MKKPLTKKGLKPQQSITLIWKRRFPKRDREKVLRLIQEIYPTAKMTESGVTLPYQDSDTRPVWIFLLWTCWENIGE